MKVYYKVYLQTREQPEKDEEGFLLQYAYKLNNALNEMRVFIPDRNQMSRRCISKVIKQNSTELKGKRIHLVYQDMPVLTPLRECFTL